MAFDRLIENIVKMQNPTVAGLDPKLDYVPESIKTKCFEKYGKTLEGAAAALFEFNKALIDALYDIVPAVKPQAAYYEMYGWQGVKALCDTIAYAKSKGMFVITDGKRNDIGTTMEAYATAHLGHTDVAGESIDAFGADALTVNGYLGTDGIKPLAKICDSDDKGIFVLVKTSNPSSGELQDMKLETNESVYEHMGKMCEGWGEDLMGKHGYSAVGAVVGATYPEQLGENESKNFRTHSSLFPVTVLRVAVPMMLKTHLTKTVLVQSSTQAAALCVHGKSRDLQKMTLPLPLVKRLSV